MSFGKERIQNRFNDISFHNSDVIFLFLLFLYTYFSVLDDSLVQVTSFIRPFKWGITGAGMILFFHRNRGIPPVRKLVFALTVLIAFFIAAKITGRTYLILYAIFIIIAEGVNSDKTVKVWLIGVALALFTILILCRIGVITDYVFLYDSGRACHCLGFHYYCYFPYLVFYCSIVYIYLKKKNVHIYHYVLVGLVNLLMYRLTTVHITFYLTIFFIIFDFLLIKLVGVSLKQKPVMVISGLLFPLGVTATYYVMRSYDQEDVRWATLNNLLHGRPAFMHSGYLRYPISLFGNRFDMVGNSVFRTVTPEEYFYIDSGFAYSLLAYGLFFTFVVVALYSLLCVFSCRRNNKHLFAWLTCVLIFTMMNNIWVDVYYNPVLLLSFTAYMEISEQLAKKSFWGSRRKHDDSNSSALNGNQLSIDAL